jgi:hypothetical protein
MRNKPVLNLQSDQSNWRDRQLPSVLASLLAIASIVQACRSTGQAEQIPSSRAIKAVVAEGYGSCPSAAMNDARVQAVRQAVGAYIMSRTRVERSAVTEDTILSLSDGSILSTKLLSEGVDESGTYKVRIMAVVANDQVIEDLMRLEGIEKPEVVDPVQNRQSTQFRTAAAVELFQDIIRQSEYPLGMFAAEARFSKRGGASRHVTSGIECVIRVDERRWRAFVSGSSRCLAALGAMDSPVDWRPRSAGTRQVEFARQPPVVGNLMGFPVTAHLNDASRATLPGPLDNVLVSTDPDAEDRTVMFVEVEPEVCRAFTLSREAFDLIAPIVTFTAMRKPTLRFIFLDERGEPLANSATTLDLNLSTGVLLLAEVDHGIPSRIRSGSGRLLQDESISATRPFQIVPAIGIHGLLVRELILRCDAPIEIPEGTVGLYATLE